MALYRDQDLQILIVLSELVQIGTKSRNSRAGAEASEESVRKLSYSGVKISVDE